MELFDFLKILFGALLGFGGTWFAAQIKLKNEALNLHREKLESLYESVCMWRSAMTGAYFHIVSKSKDYDSLIDEIEKYNPDRIEMLIRFYAKDLLSFYDVSVKAFGDLTGSLIKREEDKIITKNFKIFTRSVDHLNAVIVKESKKFIACPKKI